MFDSPFRIDIDPCTFHHLINRAEFLYIFLHLIEVFLVKISLDLSFDVHILDQVIGSSSRKPVAQIIFALYSCPAYFTQVEAFATSVGLQDWSFACSYGWNKCFKRALNVSDGVLLVRIVNSKSISMSLGSCEETLEAVTEFVDKLCEIPDHYYLYFWCPTDRTYSGISYGIFEWSFINIDLWCKISLAG